MSDIPIQQQQRLARLQQDIINAARDVERTADEAIRLADALAAQDEREGVRYFTVREDAELRSAVEHVQTALREFDEDGALMAQNLGREPIPGVHDHVNRVPAAALRRILAEFQDG